MACQGSDYPVCVLCDSCNPSCQVYCQTGDHCGVCDTCNTSCLLFCQSCDTCQNCNTCQTGCQITCDSSCQTSCQSCDTCQSCNTCQTLCEVVCQTSCESWCQTMCEDFCQDCQSAEAPTRPSNFSWTTPKVSGQPFSMAAAEWNAFTARINSFLIYKGRSSYSFVTVNPGNSFTATIFNQARNALNDLSAYFTGGYTLPGTKARYDDVMANDLNALVSCLNSIQ